MKTNRYIPVWVVVAVLIMLSSCVKDILYNTPHPESGAVVLMLEGAPDGEVFVAGIDGQTVCRSHGRSCSSRAITALWCTIGPKGSRSTAERRVSMPLRGVRMPARCC